MIEQEADGVLTGIDCWAFAVAGGVFGVQAQHHVSQFFVRVQRCERSKLHHASSFDFDKEKKPG
jgi:hypothetical protein